MYSCKQKENFYASIVVALQSGASLPNCVAEKKSFTAIEEWFWLDFLPRYPNSHAPKEAIENLLAPLSSSTSCLVNKAAVFCYLRRPDLQHAFDIRTRSGRVSLGFWFWSRGISEYGLQRALFKSNPRMRSDSLWFEEKVCPTLLEVRADLREYVDLSPVIGSKDLLSEWLAIHGVIEIPYLAAWCGHQRAETFSSLKMEKA